MWRPSNKLIPKKGRALSAASSLALPFKQQGKVEVNGYTTFNPILKSVIRNLLGQNDKHCNLSKYISGKATSNIAGKSKRHCK